MSNIAIYIIEDEGLIAQDISMMLEELGYDVAGIAADSEKALDFLANHEPDLVLCDIHIKGSRDGIEVASILAEKHRLPFIFLTSLSDRDTLERAKKTVPYGYVVKPFTAQDLISAIEMALYRYGTELDRSKITKEKVDGLALTPLSDREFEFLLDLSKGLNNKQLADKHFVSVNTVKFHIKNIFLKLDVSNRANALHKIIDLLST